MLLLYRKAHWMTALRLNVALVVIAAYLLSFATKSKFDVGRLFFTNFAISRQFKVFSYFPPLQGN